MQQNRRSIIAAILLVLIVSRIDLVLPDFRALGIPLALLAILIISRVKRSGWKELGFFTPKSWLKVVILGLGIGIILQLSALLQIRLGGPSPDISSFEQLKSNPLLLLGWLIVSWTTAGFGEEIIWRGFLLKQIARLLNESKVGWAIGLITTSVFFGLSHAYQGVTGIVMTGIAGLVYGSVMLFYKGNLWPSIFAHAFTDTIIFIILYNWDKIRIVLNL